MKRVTILTILTTTILTTASANFSFMGDMIKDMTDAAKNITTNVTDEMKEIKTDTIDIAKEMKNSGIDGMKDIKDDLNSSIKKIEANRTLETVSKK